MSSQADRIGEARERVGPEAAAVASAAGLNENWYFDVESYDKEVARNISLDQLLIITHAVGLTPLAALSGRAIFGSSLRSRLFCPPRTLAGASGLRN